jgi:hypothetical protein
MLEQTAFQVVVVLVGALSTTVVALVYFTRIRLERPAIGRFNGRDVLFLFGFIVTLPVLYLYVPPTVLTIFLVITFVSALSIGYRPVLPRLVLWPVIGALIATHILVARNLLGTTRGWQLYWALTSVAVLFAAVAVANLYVQGGMRLRHVAWFALGLAVYDPIFSFGIPLTARLADTFAGFGLVAVFGALGRASLRLSSARSCARTASSFPRSSSPAPPRSSATWSSLEAARSDRCVRGAKRLQRQMRPCAHRHCGRRSARNARCVSGAVASRLTVIHRRGTMRGRNVCRRATDEGRVISVAAAREACERHPVAALAVLRARS